MDQIVAQVPQISSFGTGSLPEAFLRQAAGWCLGFALVMVALGFAWVRLTRADPDAMGELVAPVFLMVLALVAITALLAAGGAGIAFGPLVEVARLVVPVAVVVGVVQRRRTQRWRRT